MKDFLAGTWNRLGLRGSVVAMSLLLVLIVGLQNMEPVDIDFLFWDLVEVPKLYFIFIFVVFGFAIGYLTAWWGGRKANSGW